MKRVYQLGDQTIVEAPSTVALLTDKEDIIKNYDKDTYNFLYKRIANAIRAKYGFDYYLAMSLLHPKENASEETKELAKSHIVVCIFDLEITEGTKDFYVSKYDKEKNLWYVDIEE